MMDQASFELIRESLALVQKYSTLVSELQADNARLLAALEESNNSHKDTIEKVAALNERLRTLVNAS